MQTMGLTKEIAKMAIKRIWASGLAPEVQCFLWTVLHRALPTVEGREEWMESMAIAVCTFGYRAKWNTLEHALCECRHAEAIWRLLAEWLSVRLATRYTLPIRFILIQDECRNEENQLIKKKWWVHLRAWMLHNIWSNWASATYSSKRKRTPGQIAQTGWYRAVHVCRAGWLKSKVELGKSRKPLHRDYTLLSMVSHNPSAPDSIGWNYQILERRALPEVL